MPLTAAKPASLHHRWKKKMKSGHLFWYLASSTRHWPIYIAAARATRQRLPWRSGELQKLRNSPSVGPQLLGPTSRPQPEESETPSHQWTEPLPHNQVICKVNLLFIFLLHRHSNVFDLVYSLSKHKPRAGLMIHAHKLITSPAFPFVF